MIAYLLAFAGTILLIAWGFTYVECRRASEGYEDEQGFHFGPDPRAGTRAEFVLEPVSVETEIRTGTMLGD